MNALRCLAMIAALATITPAAAAEKLIVGVHPTAVAAVSSVGTAKGYFTEQGIDFNSIWVNRGGEAIQALGAGQADLGIGASAPVIAARAKGVNIVIIGLHSHGFPASLVVSNKNPQVAQIEDLKGKRIGVPVGSGVHAVLLMAIEKTGLKSSDFQIQNARVTDMPAAMQSDGFDAVVGWIPYSTRVVTMGNGRVVMTPAQFEKAVGITYPMLVFAMEDTIRKRPEAVQKFMNAWVKSTRFVDKERAETVKLLRQTLGDRVKALDDKALTEILYGYRHDRVALTDADITDLRNMAEHMLAQKNINTKPDIGVLVNNSFALKAESQIK